MSTRKSNRWGPLLLVVVLLLALLVVKQCGMQPDIPKGKKVQSESRHEKGLNRHPNTVAYSKHARCRMECRHISKTEVREILETGKINYAKSEIGNRTECKRKYAVEGVTRDGQRVRIIFAPCKEVVTVVTVIDIGKDWPCDCN